MPILFLLVSWLFVSPVSTAVTHPAVEWRSPTEHDFGDIPLGVPVKVGFHFKNISPEPLTIDNVRATCGCTASDWEETPVAPGEEGVVKIEYDAKRPGWFRKKITVFFSGQRQAERLYVEGFVE